MKDVRISFVILTWNSRKFVSACLESVLGLGDVCLEVHVEDNGSTDGTPEMLEALAVSDRRLHVEYLDSNLGTTVSRNLALRRVSPEATHVCVLDSDTVINREAFHLMVEALQRDSRIGVVGPTMMSSSGDVQHSGRNLPTFAIKVGKACPFEKLSKRAHEAEIPTTPIIGGLQDVGYLLSACWLMPKSTIDVVGLLDERIFYAPEDVDWCLRCHKAGLRVVLVHGARIVHEYQRISRRKLVSKANCEHIKGLAYYFFKHRYFVKPPQFEIEGEKR